MKLHIALIAILLALAACAAPATLRYYTLSSGTPAAAQASGVKAKYRVSIGPVSLPEAIDREQIVLRAASNRYAISDLDRWAEPLKREIPRVLADDLAQRLPEVRVAAHMQYEGAGAQFRVPIDVLRFESVPAEGVTLEAVWSVRNGAGERLHEAHSIVTEPVSATGVAPLVAAHAKALAGLAREIALALDTLKPSP